MNIPQNRKICDTKYLKLLPKHPLEPLLGLEAIFCTSLFKKDIKCHLTPQNTLFQHILKAKHEKL